MAWIQANRYLPGGRTFHRTADAEACGLSSEEKTGKKRICREVCMPMASIFDQGWGEEISR